MTLRLHGHSWQSAAYRVRLALALKRLDYEQQPHDLRIGMQGAPDYPAFNPQGLVPALETTKRVLVQSPAILEWLEERYPYPMLLPAAAGVAPAASADTRRLSWRRQRTYRMQLALGAFLAGPRHLRQRSMHGSVAHTLASRRGRRDDGA
ncbi:hypothetical protein ASE69_18475 [Sphingomonas sp. Leaf208]|uniref:glutathione S-transferase N-terminal domain-containing protein n=1 Tax=Sphingomonas sp. Leaf208 TaxID=1735679 RepID=UPI0006F809A7|nr:glutathione S-transferase N-terminal domain-containing protein [Sphingomonas sp. Leaf208]KQM54485.1 hypothetical protein ASE69_18475 [Sphingomonas sp. Leaf208]